MRRRSANANADYADATNFPGLKVDGYTTTPPMVTPCEIEREAILIEWTDTNVANDTFEGTARELMRLQLNTRIHPMGDLIFNPAARPGDPDWRDHNLWRQLNVPYQYQNGGIWPYIADAWPSAYDLLL